MKVDFSDVQTHLEETYALAFLLSEVQEGTDNPNYWRSAMRVLFYRVKHAFLEIEKLNKELNGN